MGGLPLGALGAITPTSAQALATWDSGNWSTFAVVGAFTATVVQVLNGSTTYLTLTGAAGAAAMTTPTAQQLVQQYIAAYGVPPVNGSTVTLEISNQSNGTITFTAGTGVTINGTATIATTANRTYLATFTNSSNTSQAAVTYQNVASRTN